MGSGMISSEGVTVVFICVQGRWMSSLRDVRVYRGTDVASDHHLLVAKLKVKLMTIQGPRGRKKNIDVENLETEEMRKSYQLELKNRFNLLEIRENEEGSAMGEGNEDMDAVWERWRDVVVQTDEDVLGFKRGNRKEAWISKETWNAINERRKRKQRMEQAREQGAGYQVAAAEYKEQDEVKKKCRYDKSQYILRKTVEAEDAGRRGDSKTLYRIVKELSGGTKPQTRSLRKTDGHMTKSHDEEVRRWREHFEGVLNCDARKHAARTWTT